MAQLTQRVSARIPADPLTSWLERLDQDTRPANRSHLERWMTWLRKQPGWEQVTPREVLVRHLDSDDSYFVLDLLQKYINSLVLRKSSKRKAYSVIRSFFLHNRARSQRIQPSECEATSHRFKPSCRRWTSRRFFLEQNYDTGA